jgi:hypothetical protein
LRLLKLAANAGECCVASELLFPSKICPGNSKDTAELTATAKTEAEESDSTAWDDPLTNSETRLKFRVGHIFASMLRALSSASATLVKPLATNVLDLGKGVDPELMASTRAWTLRKVVADASVGKNISGELKDTGAREKNGTCNEDPFT